MSRLPELQRHGRVKADHHVALLGHLLVPFFLLSNDPVLERLTDDGCTDIDDPLLRDLRHVFCVRKVSGHLWLAVHELKDSFEAQILVHWHVQ